MDSSTIIPFLTSIIGALIGTFVGAFCVHKFQQKGIIKNRKTAIKALKIFCDYNKKPFTVAENQFNTLTVSEKRAVVVALHKLGVPFKIVANEVFDINNIHFNDIAIDKDEINGMIDQVDHGNCDSFFFNDVESYFSDNMRLLTARSIAKKYVYKVLSQSIVDSNEKKMISPDDWISAFTFGEYKTIQVFRDQVNDTFFFDTQGKPIPEKVSSLLKDIDLGLWDTYLMWSYEAYRTIKSQNEFVESQLQSNTIPQPRK